MIDLQVIKPFYTSLNLFCCQITRKETIPCLWSYLSWRQLNAYPNTDGAEKAAGICELQGLCGHGHHIIGHLACLDHGAVHHATKGGWNNGVHRTTRQSWSYSRWIWEVIPAIPLLSLAMANEISICNSHLSVQNFSLALGKSSIKNSVFGMSPSTT